MVEPEIKTYHLPPTRLIPNSPHRPLLYYPGLLHVLKDTQQKSPVDDGHSSPSSSPTSLATIAYDTFTSNDWDVQWIYRYGPTQKSHYHSSVHECMAVLSGSAMIRFGIADGEADGEAGRGVKPDIPTSTSTPSTDPSSTETRDPGWTTSNTLTPQTLSTTSTQSTELAPFRGVFIHASAGDVFVLPAGVAHKTYDTKPEAEFALLTPGDGHGIQVPPDSSSTSTTSSGSSSDAAARKRNAVITTPLSGFTMLGAYPKVTETGDPDLGEWDFATGGEDVGRYEQVWSVKKPARDPCLGDSEKGIWGLW
ncbi:hypothetical protein ABEF95_001808 [Exophiala dermatitidis]